MSTLGVCVASHCIKAALDVSRVKNSESSRVISSQLHRLPRVDDHLPPHQQNYDQCSYPENPVGLSGNRDPDSGVIQIPRNYVLSLYRTNEAIDDNAGSSHQTV